MGATTFYTVAKGASAEEAFRLAVDRAKHEYGHGGYTGTIAEKRSFVVIQPNPADFQKCLAEAEASEGTDAAGANKRRRKAFFQLAQDLSDTDPRVAEKRGPAGCFDLEEGVYLFFGWAPE